MAHHLGFQSIWRWVVRPELDQAISSPIWSTAMCTESTPVPATTAAAERLLCLSSAKWGLHGDYIFLAIGQSFWAHNLCDPNFYQPTQASTATSTGCIYLCDACTLRAMHIMLHTKNINRFCQEFFLPSKHLLFVKGENFTTSGPFSGPKFFLHTLPEIRYLKKEALRTLQPSPTLGTSPIGDRPLWSWFYGIWRMWAPLKVLTLPETNSSPMKIPIFPGFHTIKKMVDFPWAKC